MNDDVDVIARDMLDEAHRKLHPCPWLVQFADGQIAHFDTEEDACAFQRGWRRRHGLDPMTGEPTT